MTRRRLLSWAAILALLFAQASMAAYACASPASMPASAMPEDCPGHAPAGTDAVCALHCSAGATLPATHTPDVAPVVSGVLVVALPVPSDLRPSFVPTLKRYAMATAPPVAIRFCRLLI
jgi:hypothetical protein